MKDRFTESVIHNFEVSVVMPFYKKLREFQKVLPSNAGFFQRNGIEVVVVMDDPSEEAGLLELLIKYPFINWKVIINDKIHEPRNPTKALNVGIRHATKKYVFVSSPETLLYTDVIFQLRSILEYYPDHYAIGTVAFIQEDTNITNKTIKSFWFLPYGSFMARKEYLERVTGYDESFEKWGGDDDNIRKRLDMAGVHKLFVPECKSLHLEKKSKLVDRLKTSGSFTPEHLRKIVYPKIVEVNGNDWGRNFSRVAYNWQNKKDAEKLCRIYLSEFDKFDVNSSQVFGNGYKKLILCQAYNEAELLPGFLENMARYFDGIILLDDGSTDETYDLAKHEKILLKVRKKHTEFNDLQNKNILLNIASFFQSDWFCFMDIDERFDERFDDLDCVTCNSETDVVTFCFIHLWDYENMYVTVYPYTIKGLFRMKRMFRNTGRMQINTKFQKLHFEASPLKANIMHSNILIKHLGNLTKERRIRRYQYYCKEDTNNDQHSYEHLLSENPALKSIDGITQELLVQSALHCNS